MVFGVITAGTFANNTAPSAVMAILDNTSTVEPNSRIANKTPAVNNNVCE